MKLVRARVVGLAPFEDVTVSFVKDDAPRALTVVFGGDRTGKSTLLASIATTRPGFAVPPPPRRRAGVASTPAWVACDWLLGQDDPDRPHLLRVTSPTAPVVGESPEEAAFRRKEQALFDRRAQEQGGFALVLVSGARWFSRTHNMLTQPEKTVARYDVRAAPVVEDATRADLTRETKQILSYAAIGSALERARAPQTIGPLAILETALADSIDALLEPFGRTWDGVTPETLEPAFKDARGHRAPFEELPRGARHLVAIASLAVRALASHTPRKSADADASELEEPNDPRENEGVVLVDDIELGQDTALLRRLPHLLQTALPNVQWIVSTASPLIGAACAPGDIIALRRDDEHGVAIHEGESALIH